MLSKLKSWLTDNEKKTRKYCKDLLGQLKRTHLDPVLQRLRGKEAAKVSFDDVIDGYTRIKDSYYKSAKGAKDAIAAVFFEFHPVRNPYFMNFYFPSKNARSEYHRFLIECRKLRLAVTKDSDNPLKQSNLKKYIQKGDANCGEMGTNKPHLVAILIGGISGESFFFNNLAV